MKRALLAFPVLLITLVAVVLIVPSFIDWNKYKAQAREKIQDLAGYDIEIKGDLGLSILPMPNLYIDDIIAINPAAGEQGRILRLKRLKVSVDIIPLFSKQIDVRSVNLVEPDITIATLKDGRQNWQNDTLDALMKGKNEDDQDAKENKQGTDIAEAISLKNVGITDGTFTFINGDNPATILNNIDMDLNAQTLKGPFVIDTSLRFKGQPVEAQINLDALEEAKQSLGINADVKYVNAMLQYTGTLDFVDAIKAQGDLSLNVNSLTDFLKAQGVKSEGLAVEKLSVKGRLKATAKQVALSQMTLDADTQRFNGDARVALSPMTIDANLKAAKAFNIDLFLPKPQKGQSKSVAGLSKTMPAKMPSPFAFDLDLKAALPALIYKGQAYNDVNIVAAKRGNALNTMVKIVNGPGGLNADLNTKIQFSSDGTKPSIKIGAKGRVKDLPATVHAITGAPLKLSLQDKSLAFDGALRLNHGNVQLDQSAVTFGGTKYGVSGALEGPNVIVNIDAYGGQAIAKGALGNGFEVRNVALQLKHPNLARALDKMLGVKVAYKSLASPLDFHTTLNQSGKTYNLTNIKAKVAQTNMTGTLGFNGGGAKPAINGVLTFGDLTLQTNKAASAPKAAGVKASKRWSQEKIDVSWMNKIDADFDVTAKKIQYESWDLASPKVKLKLNAGVFTLEQLSAALYGGRASVSGTARRGTNGGVKVQGKTALNDIALEPMVKSLVGSRLLKGSGIVNMDADFSANGVSQAQVISNLVGQGVVSGKSLVLQGIDAERFARALSDNAKPGDSLLSLWKGSTSGGSTAFDTLDGSFNMAQGVANIPKMDLDGPKALIATTGRVDFLQSRIKTAHTITLKQRDDVPPFTINIDGPLSNPGQTFAKGAINDFLGRKINRKLEKIIGDKLGGELDGKLGNALGNLLGVQKSKPTANDNAAPSPAPIQEPNTPKETPKAAPQPEEMIEDAVNDLLKGLF